MKKIKKYLAAVLAACLVLTNVLPAYAETESEPVQEEQVIEVQENAGEQEIISETEEADEATTSEAEYKETVIEADSEDEETIEEAEDDKALVFEKTVDGIKVTLTADAGVFPKNAKISVKKVTDKEIKKAIDEAVEEARDEEANVASSIKLDIKVLVDGEEVQPDTSKGEVKITFTLAQKVSEKLEANVYHLIEDGEENLTAEVLETEIETVATEEAADKTEAEDTEVAAERDEGNTTESEGREGEAEIKEVTEISALTDGFSYYVVEFTYGELRYVLEGDSEIKLSEILDTLGLEGTVTKAGVSDKKLFTVEKDEEGDDWTVTALQAFSSKEWMKITIDGQVYEITVMDDASVSTIYWGIDNAWKLTISGEELTGTYIDSGSFDSNLVFDKSSQWLKHAGDIKTVVIADEVKPASTSR